MESTIKKIIELTKESKIEWNYLDSAPNIYEPLNYSYKNPSGISAFQMQLEGNSKKYFDNANSFYSKVNNNFILLVADNDTKKLMLERLQLILVPRTFKEPKYFINDEDLLYLHNMVKGNFPSADDIINDLFSL